MTTAKEWIQEQYPEMIPEWGQTGHDDEFMCKMMEAYAARQIEEATKDCYPKKFVIWLVKGNEGLVNRFFDNWTKK